MAVDVELSHDRASRRGPAVAPNNPKGRERGVHVAEDIWPLAGTYVGADEKGTRHHAHGHGHARARMATHHTAAVEQLDSNCFVLFVSVVLLCTSVLFVSHRSCGVASLAPKSSVLRVSCAWLHFSVVTVRSGRLTCQTSAFFGLYLGGGGGGGGTHISVWTDILPASVSVL
mgnify:FL=1